MGSGLLGREVKLQEDEQDKWAKEGFLSWCRWVPFPLIRVLLSLVGELKAIYKGRLYKCKFPLLKEDLCPVFRVFLLSVVFSLKTIQMPKQHLLEPCILGPLQFIRPFLSLLVNKETWPFKPWPLGIIPETKIKFPETGLIFSGSMGLLVLLKSWH